MKFWLLKDIKFFISVIYCHKRCSGYRSHLLLLLLIMKREHFSKKK